MAKRILDVEIQICQAVELLLLSDNKQKVLWIRIGPEELEFFLTGADKNWDLASEKFLLVQCPDKSSLFAFYKVFLARAVSPFPNPL